MARCLHHKGNANMWKSAIPSSTIAGILALALMAPRTALAWGNEGHEIVAVIAQAYLDPAVRKKLTAMLAADTSDLTTHDIPSEATWADEYRNRNVDNARRRTSNWHFVDIEIADPNIDQACFGHPEPAQPASAGPDKDCVVDKIQEFADELANPDTDPEEQVLALKFLLHFVGDIHQPLHASDNHDRGGNEKKVSAAGQPSGNLHHYWDDVFVEQLGPNAKSIASDLIGHISEDQVRQWSQGTASDWAMESFKVAKDDAYGQLPDANSKHVYRLSEDYMATATQDVALQLSKGGVRLAFVLNQTLGPRSR
jgi:nuclease S1